MHCNKCGKELDKDDKFCRYCGAPVHQFCEDVESKNKPTVESIEKHDDKNDSPIMGIILGLFLNIIGIFVCHSLYPNNNKAYRASLITTVIMNALIIIALIITLIVLFL